MVQGRLAKLLKIAPSRWVIIVFGVALIVPWVIFTSVTLVERSQRLEDAERNLSTLVLAYGNVAAMAHSDNPVALRLPGVNFSLRGTADRDAPIGRTSSSPPIAGTIVRRSGDTIRAEVRLSSGGVAVATMDAASVLAGWRKIAAIEAASLLLRSLVAVGIAAFLVQQLRWREKTQAQLAIAREAADAANHAKSEFLANMSHELRTPLNAIIGFSEVIKMGMMGPLDSRYREYAGDIFNSGGHLLNLVNEILDLSKLEVGQFELYEEEVDLTDAIQASLRLVETQAKKAKIELFSMTQPDIRIRADGRRLRQILINILSNAVKFTRDGGQVRLTAVKTENGLVMEIRDSGIGMMADQIAKALEPFGQIESSTSRKHEGTGLGLPLAKRLVELHGGKLTIKSEVDVGTTVTIALPPERYLPGTSAAAPVLFRSIATGSLA
jgi:signal transduction histidine kinase